ncbi:hypothetical protein Pcinc_023300 [Petrolisthes cinctipes]|uniref:Uncharacterized protein n=1 Tax=Petrolisthes cinctipes TaxID=88211 RepID=A0AAE1FCB7_PETCI|nr:hypothetical protein Pcinc_023300 [Petrolisthes cinctipes]
MSSVEREYSGWWPYPTLILGTYLLALGLLLLVIFIITFLLKILKQKPKQMVPLPTPPMCHRRLSTPTVYPPTPPISREKFSIYTICRPTPPASPLTYSKTPSVANTQLPAPVPVHLLNPAPVTRTPPLKPKQRPLHTTLSLPSHLYDLARHLPSGVTHQYSSGSALLLAEEGRGLPPDV